MTLQIVSPIGRLVQGDCFEPQTTDQQGAPLVVKTGPNAGQPRKEWFIAIAIRKDDPAWAPFYGEVYKEAVAAWPALFPQGMAGPCTLPTFAFKIIDGDSYDTTGKPWSSREGFAGCWVIRCGSGYPPKCFPAGKYNPVDQITDPNLLRRGFYVRAQLTITSNKNPQKPGLYMNFGLVELSGYGPDIISGPDPAEAFGKGPGALPPGASAYPTSAPPAAGAGTPPGGQSAYIPPPAGSPPGMAGAGPPAMTGASPSSAAPPPTHTAYMAPGATAPPPAPAAPAPAAPPPPAPAGRQMTAKAAPHSYEQLIASGWTEAQLIEHGMMIP